MMKRKIMAACGMVILAGFLLGGCGSVESGIVRTTAAGRRVSESGRERILRSGERLERTGK